jgi:hypothetical protein
MRLKPCGPVRIDAEANDVPPGVRGHQFRVVFDVGDEVVPSDKVRGIVERFFCDLLNVD